MYSDNIQYSPYILSLQVKEKIFGNSRSGGEFGTSEWSMNVLGTTNAKKGPHECYNAYREFCDKELDAHILAAAMEHFGMTNVEGMCQTVCIP